MTGEITLRGRVLPIGGLKEKLLAALRGGIKKVLIPEENAKDLADIPDAVKNGLEIVPVARMEEVLQHALVSQPTPDRLGGGRVRARQARRGALAEDDTGVRATDRSHDPKQTSPAPRRGLFCRRIRRENRPKARICKAFSHARHRISARFSGIFSTSSGANPLLFGQFGTNTPHRFTPTIRGRRQN